MPEIESSLYAAIGDFDLDGPNAQNVNVRLPGPVVEYISALARQNDRSVAEEIRAALRVSVLMSRLNIVLDDELQASRRDASDGILGLTPDTAAKYANSLREDLAEEWRKMLPGLGRRFLRNFPNYLFTVAPPTYTVVIDVPPEDFGMLETVTADIPEITPTPRGELEFKVVAESLAAAGDVAWQRLGDLREQAGLPRLADGSPRGFGYR